MGSIGARFPTLTVPLAEHPATLPEVEIPDDFDHEAVATESLPKLLDITSSDLTENAIWRDTLALTGTFRTFHTLDVVKKTWRHLCKQAQITDLVVIPGTIHVLRFGPKASWLQASFSFSTNGTFPATCSGSIGLIPDNGSWKIWLITTILEQPTEYPNVDKLEPGPSDLNIDQVLDCAVVGGAVAGLDMAGRLKSLGLSYVVMEQSAELGDIWTKNRYESVKLHTSREFNQLPGTPRTFRPEDPYYLDAHDLAMGFQRYVKTFGINIMTSTTVKSAKYDAAQKIWTITAQRGEDVLTVSARHLVLATGSMGSSPIKPEYLNPEKYQGDTIHALRWKNAMPWKGKRGIVIGSANSAHDIIADMVKADFSSITMVQRSKTWVMPASTFSALVDPVYNTETPTEVSDRMLMGYPLPVQRLVAMELIRECADKKPEYFDELEAHGFKHERYGDLWGLLYDREGGHFFDVGAGKLIAEGKVKVKSDALPIAYTETGLEFSDGDQMDADVVVFATGYKGDIRDCAKRIIGEGVVKNLEGFWQCDREGETRGAWRDTGHPALWYTGHGYATARYYSRFLAMRIKADVEGRPIREWTDSL